MGLDRLTALWTKVRDSLWFVPTVMTLAAVVLAVITIRLDLAGVADVPPPDDDAAVPGPLRLLFAGSASGAREILTVIATGLITVTGVVFSVTIVALQLASTQFTPRILRNFTSDRGNQVVLGMFIATFTYALVVQRVVRGDSDVTGGFVPNLSITVAMVLALTSIGFLIFFIDHAARSVQASVIIDRVAYDGRRALRRTLGGEAPGPVEDEVDRHVPRVPGTAIPAQTSGYLQGVDEEVLMELLEEGPGTIRMEPNVGAFVLEGSPLATVWPPGTDPDGKRAREVRSAFILGHERTPHLDVELPVLELVDIAVKALSPGVNDPTTATLCLDRITELIVAFGRREPPPRVHVHPESGGVLLLPRVSFEHFVDTALDQIRHFGVSNPHFATGMLRRLAPVARLLPPRHREPLAKHAELIRTEALWYEPDPTHAVRIERAARDVTEALDGMS